MAAREPAEFTSVFASLNLRHTISFSCAHFLACYIFKLNILSFDSFCMASCLCVLQLFFNLTEIERSSLQVKLRFSAQRFEATKPKPTNMVQTTSPSINSRFASRSVKRKQTHDTIRAQIIYENGFLIVCSFLWQSWRAKRHHFERIFSVLIFGFAIVNEHIF